MCQDKILIIKSNAIIGSYHLWYFKLWLFAPSYNIPILRRLQCSTISGALFNRLQARISVNKNCETEVLKMFSQDGYFGHPGYYLAEQLGISVDSIVLFAVFSRSQDEPSCRPNSRESALCVYNIQVKRLKIRKVLRKVSLTSTITFFLELHVWIFINNSDVSIMESNSAEFR